MKIFKIIRYSLILTTMIFGVTGCTKNQEGLSTSSSSNIASSISSMPQASSQVNSGSGSNIVKDNKNNLVSLNDDHIVINGNNFTKESMHIYVLNSSQIGKIKKGTEYNKMISDFGVKPYKLALLTDDIEQADNENVIYFDENYKPIILELKNGIVENVIK